MAQVCACSLWKTGAELGLEMGSKLSVVAEGGNGILPNIPGTARLVDLSIVRWKDAGHGSGAEVNEQGGISGDSGSEFCRWGIMA